MDRLSSTMRRIGALAAVAALAPALAPGAATAGAFQIREGSARTLGAALSGRTSGDANVSFALQNPAALSGVARGEVSSGVAGIFASADATTDATLPGFKSADNPSETAFVPSLAVGWRVRPDVVLGLTVDAPFGLATEYDDEFIGSFMGVESELLNVVVTPMVAWEPTPGVSLGAGVSLSYADAKLTNRTAGVGVASLEGDDFALGFRLGAQARLAERTTVGIAYRSGIDHKLEGEFSDNYVVPTPGGLVGLGGPGSAKVDLPQSVSFGITQGVTDRLRVMAEGEFVGWSSYEEVRAISGLTGIAVVEEQNYEDSWMGSVGVEYDATEALTLRAGFAYDQTPSPAEFRTVRVPDADKMWFSLGLTYSVTEQLSVDAAYTYVRFDDTSVNVTRPDAIAGERIDYDSDAHLVAVNLNYRF